MTETKYFTLTKNLKTNQTVDAYTVLEFIDAEYTVRLVYADGHEAIEQGDLEYFNSRFEITEVKVITRGFDNFALGI